MTQSTNTQSRATVGLDAKADQEDAPNVQHWEPGLKPSRSAGYTLAGGRRHTRAMLPTQQHSAIDKLNLASWQKPYAEALLATEPQSLAKLLATAEREFFKRILELADENASDEREDISRAIDVVLDLKAAQANSKRSDPGEYRTCTSGPDEQ